MRYEAAIIGAGAAGVSAALNLKALGINFIWFGKSGLSSKTGVAERIMNYPGLLHPTGAEFRDALFRQITEEGLGIIQKTVTGIYAGEGFFTVLANNELYESASIILATGVDTGRQIAGEREFLGRGVSYCATCDGRLYQGKKIAVICSAKSLFHEAEFLASLAEKTYFLPLYKNEENTAGTPQKNIAENIGGNIIPLKKMPTQIIGKTCVEAIICDTEEIAVDGVFLLKESLPAAALLGGIRAEGGHVLIDRACRTNLPGCFAAGDITGRPYQYAKAIGEGCVAAHSVFDYLFKK